MSLRDQKVLLSGKGLLESYLVKLRRRGGVGLC